MPDITEITITRLNEMIKKKEISVRELTQEYINRINYIDKSENGLNSVLEINPEALDIASKLDEHHTEINSPLFGLPILLKDNINTADKMHTSAGALALKDNIAPEDAEIVKTFREKGSIMLGKTNMTEFANYMSLNMPAGYSSRGGQVVSPYNREESPSGSSTGSAVAVTSNLCVASIGTDTSGSIASPALHNGIVGFCPSSGILSQKGVVPISFTLDTVGPMAKTVEDAAIIYSELSGKKLAIPEEQDVQGITIAMDETEYDSLNEEEVKKAETAINELEKAGAKIKKIKLESITKEEIKTVQRYEFKFAMNRYLSSLSREYSIKNLKDIIEYNKQHPEQALAYGQELLEDAQENTSGNLTETEYIEMLKHREEIKLKLYEQMKDVNVCIFFKEKLALHYTGLPIITVPRGSYNNKMPFGFYLSSLTDNDLIHYAYRIEKSVGHRVQPDFDFLYVKA